MPKTQYIQQKENFQRLFMKRGDILSEFFEISDKARDGGMGDVFFCRDKRDNKFYVLKTFNDIALSDQFKEEVLFSLSIPKHPNIVYSRTVVTDESNYYLVMDFIGKQPYSLNEEVQGSTLAQVIYHYSLENKQALIWGIQICQGMEFLHECGLKSHKDLKPENILISPTNEVKITDFGLASSKKQGGTIGYQAPECIKNKSADIRSDIYSFGVILYQMLNHGAFPFAEGNSYSISKSKLKESFGACILEKCLAEEPSKRYDDFTQIKEELLACLENHFPEYQMPKKIHNNTQGHVWDPEQDELMFLGSLLLYSNELQAEELLLRGIGFYLLKQYLAGFMYLSKAIEKNKNLKGAYSYRYKCRCGIISDQTLAIARWFVYLISFLILAFINNLVGLVIYYNTGWLVITPVLDIIMPLVLILFFSHYWDYEISKNKKIQILYYLVPIEQLFLMLFSKHAFFAVYNYYIEWVYAGIFVLVVGGGIAYSTWKVVQRRKKKEWLSAIWLYLKIIYTFEINGIRYGWQLLFNHDKVSVKSEKQENAWEILNNRNAYPLVEYGVACLRLYQDPGPYSYDIILHHNILFDKIVGNYSQMLKHCEELEKKFDYRSTSLYWALFEKALFYKKRGNIVAETESWNKIVSLYAQLCMKTPVKVDFIRDANNEYPKGELNERMTVAFIVLVAYFQTRENLEGYYFAVASSYFLVLEREFATIFYEKFLKGIKEVDFEEIDKNTENALQEFNKYFFKESKQLYFSVNELKWQAARLYQRLGLCEYELKQYSKAFYYFSKAIQYEPHNKKLYTWRRMAARKTLFYPGCIKDLYCCILCCLDYGITLRKEMSRNI